MLPLGESMTNSSISSIDHKISAEPMIEEGEASLLVMNRQYEVQFISAEARKLMAMFAVSEESPSPQRKNHVVIPSEIKFLCQRLEKISCDNAMAPNKAVLPIWEKHETDASFVFRAHWLGKIHEPQHALIAITIRRKLPLSRVLQSNAKKLGLTKRQVHVCTLLAAGHTYNETAAALQISPHTVIDHARKLFAVLKIKNRTELLSKLMCKA